ncbi:MBL fold metallo-hydrolase [Telmatospirillum sp.]|uniref:MBL fold metallo-hydrolase n=1 Tax=Telmatospirillum sp. TaxID=2079197 RepID=UPI00284BE95F|nr:MBL fold metallo-hydrolase [Telmatospirillum sp.]MDR3438735.1 MBL fold metallo-hydrolase [Telmatospirillum sp.]
MKSMFSALVMAGSLLATPVFAQPAPIAPQQQQAPGFYRVKLGTYTVTALTDGTTPVRFDTLIHRRDKAVLDRAYREKGIDDHRETSINAFLVDTGEKRILIDAGTGKLFGDCCGRIPKTLEAAGYSVESIDTILLTHVHADHSGGLTQDGSRIFPNADIYVAKAELDYWFDDQAKAHAKTENQKMFVEGRASLAPYIAAGRIRTFLGAATLFPGIRSIPAPGHTPGHSFYEVENEGHRMLFLGDVVHLAEIQLPYPSTTIDFDADESLAAQTRKRVLSELADSHELAAAPHISFPGMGHIYRDGKGYGWAPIPYSANVVEVGQ